MKPQALMVAILILLSSCSYKAETLETPAMKAAISYGSPVPGRWLLFVDATALDRSIKSSGFVCAAHRYPVELAVAFTTSVRQTIDNVVDEVVTVAAPANSSQMAAMGAHGLITVRGDAFQPLVKAKVGVIRAEMDSQSYISASVTVDSRDGQILAAAVEGQGTSTAPAGFACEGGSKALVTSSGQALSEILGRISEVIGNSERMRKAVEI